MYRYQSKDMEVDIKIISSESFLNMTISALIHFKTFLRPLSQKCQNLTFSKMPKFNLPWMTNGDHLDTVKIDIFTCKFSRIYENGQFREYQNSCIKYNWLCRLS